MIYTQNDCQGCNREGVECLCCTPQEGDEATLVYNYVQGAPNSAEAIKAYMEGMTDEPKACFLERYLELEGMSPI